jgi:hypothetical protein
MKDEKRGEGQGAGNQVSLFVFILAPGPWPLAPDSWPLTADPLMEYCHAVSALPVLA